MKKLVFLLVGIIVSLNVINVNADEIFYTNANGVSMTEAQYDFFGEFYWDGYQEYVTEAQFNKFLTRGYFNSTIEKVEYDEELIASSNIHLGDEIQGTTHETTAKKLTISKACSGSICDIATTLKWKGTPNVKSYDVIGALLYNGVTLYTEPSTTLTYSGGTLFYGDEYYVGGGFGTSVKLQTSSTNMRITQDFEVTGTGTIYASYQHATSNISKSTSQLYNVAYGGYGGVFHFYGAAVGVFDGMGGVNISI